MIGSRVQCRICNSLDLVEYLNLGLVPVADNFTQFPQPDLRFELAINFCKECGWSQLSNLLDPVFMYQHDYPYDSRITNTGKSHWREFASSVKSRYRIAHGQYCLDIGSNTGALLTEFKELGFSVLGIDPSKTACLEAEKFKIETICCFFENLSDEVIIERSLEGKFSVITSTNSFAHVDELHKWIKRILRLLKPNGVLIIEVPHILELITKLQFDTIYHEHLSYCSISPLVPFFNNFGLEIIAVEKRQIHGGTIRIHIAKVGEYTVEDSVSKAIDEERFYLLNELSTYFDFGAKILRSRTIFRKEMENLKSCNLGIVSAPAKGVTFYHFMGLDDYPIVGISDKSNFKTGKFFPGTSHKVISDEELAKLEPNALLILAWNFAHEISAEFNAKAYVKPTFIIGIPNFAIV